MVRTPLALHLVACGRVHLPAVDDGCVDRALFTCCDAVLADRPLACWRLADTVSTAHDQALPADRVALHYLIGSQGPQAP